MFVYIMCFTLYYIAVRLPSLIICPYTLYTALSRRRLMVVKWVKIITLELPPHFSLVWVGYQGIGRTCDRKRSNLYQGNFWTKKIIGPYFSLWKTLFASYIFLRIFEPDNRKFDETLIFVSVSEKNLPNRYFCPSFKDSAHGRSVSH